MYKSKTLRYFWYKLSSKQRFLVRKLYYFPIVFFDKIKGDTNKYVPTRGAIYTGSPSGAKNYLTQGQQQLKMFRSQINLQPTDAVLDIGSGVGRSAIALATYITSQGSYDGFDVVKQGVDWCNSGLGEDFPNFNFKFVPVYNDLYNTSELKATDFVFPYIDNCFNKIICFSLFTHLQVDEIQHYFHEIARVLTFEGLGFATFFLYDDDNERHITTQKEFAFAYKHDGYRLMDKNVKSGNIALHKNTLLTMLKTANLECVKINDGFWKTTSTDLDEYQDVVIFKKLKTKN